LVARKLEASGQIIIDSHEQRVQIHNGVLTGPNIFSNGDRVPLGLLVLCVNHVHCRATPRSDVIECQRAVAKNSWLGERAQHVGVVDMLDDKAIAFFEALAPARTR
jgi:hypothetical protein